MTAIVIAGISFPTKAAVRRRVQGLLEKLGPTDPAEFSFLYGLVMHHANAASKVGPGIARFEVRVNRPFKTKGFWIIRTDGTETDFSYLECLRPSTNANRFSAACRTAVSGQIQEFKSRRFESESVACALSGIPLCAKNCHVDHAPPWTFDALVQVFLEKENIDVESVGFLEGDRILHVEFSDSGLGRRFGDFHAQRARLRCLHKSVNLSLPRDQRREDDDNP